MREGELVRFGPSEKEFAGHSAARRRSAAARDA